MSAPRLGPQEKRVLALIEEGLTADEIAVRLRLSRNTVRTKVRRMCQLFACPVPALPGAARERGVRF